MSAKISPADKARATASVALESNNRPVDPSCTDCSEIPPVRAIILYPNLGTPLIVHPEEKKLNIFIAAEAKSRMLFGISQAMMDFPALAPVGYIYVDKHLRIYSINSKKTKDDTKNGRLWNDGKICSSAFKNVKVWCLGRLQEGIVRDVDGKIFANIRLDTIKRYNETVAAHADSTQPLSQNVPLEWIYQVQIDSESLPQKMKPGQIKSLAWMLAIPDSYRRIKELSEIFDWEYQDKLIYDFLAMQKSKAEKRHVTDLYEFDLHTGTSNKLPEIKRTISKRLQAWHPFMLGKNQTLKIGHLSDVHVNCRQFSLANSNVCVLEGVSSKVGLSVDNCFIALKELFESMKENGADAIFLTGDLLDFNRNLDPRKVLSGDPKDQWEAYNLAKNLSDDNLYPRGIDDMLVFSLLRYSYEKLNLPVYLTTGNHEAYDVPYGISPRANPFVLEQAYEQASHDKDVVVPARVRAVAEVAKYSAKKVRGFSERVKNIPYVGSEWANTSGSADKLLAKALNKLKVSADPDEFDLLDTKMNEGIPADHNLTIYEACLIYGPSFPQVAKPFNFVPENYDWFFTLFTPLADFRINFGNQTLIGLDWGDSEIMVNLDMSGKEAWATPWNTDALLGAVSGLPRSDKSINEKQKELIEEARQSGKVVMLFSHFTLINYDTPVPLSHVSKKFIASDDVFNEYTKGTFSRERNWLYSRLNNGIHYTLSGHSHRSAVYCLNNTDHSSLHVNGYQPEELNGKNDAADTEHVKLFKNRNLSRITVSSCGGPIGIQNIRGELYGWNLMPPSGTLVDIKADGARELQRVAVKKYKQGKPRFCVALDFVQVHKKKQIVAWIPKGEAGHYWLIIGNIAEAKPFIAALTFYIWDNKKNKFKKYLTAISSAPNSACLYNCYIEDFRDFFEMGISRSSADRRVFAQLDFDHSLAGNPMYSHYNFNDPWIFRVDVTSNGDAQPFIAPSTGGRAEVPDWGWLAKVNPNRYPTPTTKVQDVKSNS